MQWFVLLCIFVLTLGFGWYQNLLLLKALLLSDQKPLIYSTNSIMERALGYTL